MKKTFQSGLSILTCVALLFSVLFVTPIKASAAGTEHLHLSIEGAASEILSSDVSFSSGESMYNILKDTLDAHSISYSMPDSSYGRSLDMIAGQGGSYGNYDTYWSTYVNDAYSDKGIGTLYPKNGDNVVIGIIGYNYNSSTKEMTEYTNYPSVSLSNRNPKPGETVTATVTNLSTGAAISDATISFNGVPLTPTDNSGDKFTATMPSSEGIYNLSVSKENSTPNADYPLLLRRTIPITVSNTLQTATIGVSDSNRTIDLSSGSVSTVNITGGNAVTLQTAGGQIPAALTAAFHNSYNLFTVHFAAGTTVSGTSGWDGKLSLEYPTGPFSVPNGTSAMAVTIGSTQNLTLSNYSKITLNGATGKKAGTIDASGYFHQISTKLSSDAVPDGFTEPDAYYDDGHDLIIYTKHLSTFVAYTPAAAGGYDIGSAISSAAGYLTGTGDDDYWAALALSRSGNTVPAGFLTDTAQTISDNGSSFTNVPNLAMTIIGLRAAGANPLNFNGINLVEKLYTFDKIDATGANGPTFALLALDSGKYDVPSSAKWNDASLIAQLKTYQKSDGGFSLSSGGSSNPDITAMAITALAPHRADAEINTAIDAALNYLSSKLTSNVGLIPAGSTNESSETASWAVIALSSVGVDPANDDKFIKTNSSGKKVSLLDNLMSFRLSSGAFEDQHGSGADTMATQQALMALSAYQRFLSGAPRLFDLTDTSGSITSVSLDNPHTGSADFTPVMIIAPCMIALLAATNLKRRRRAK